MRRRSIITVGSGNEEIKIYTLHRKDGYPSLQCAWYELGKRKTKTFASMDAAKLFAQQTISSCRHELPCADPATQRDFDLLRACEARAKRFGLNMVSAFEEWSDAKLAMKGGSILDAVRFFHANHAGLPNKLFKDVADECFAAKEAAGISHAYRRCLRRYLARMKDHFGSQPIADITTAQVDAWLRTVNGNHTSKNNFRRVFVTLFKWAREIGYLIQDRRTAPERAITFNGPESAPAIFTPAEMRKLLNVCRGPLLLPVVIGAFSGIRAAEIARLDWEDVLWDRGFIEIKAAKAKTRARRLLPLLPNLRAWLEPMRKAEGPVCVLSQVDCRLSVLGRRAGVRWRQNALRHSYASYRLAEIQDAAKVALEMGNSPDKLFRHYRALVSAEAAKEWFSIMPGAAVDVAQVA